VGHSKAAKPRQAGLQTCTLGADLPAGVSFDLYLGSVDPPGVGDPCSWVCKPCREEK